MERFREMAIDIETFPELTDEQIASIREEIKAPSNWKDPEKIEQYKSENLIKKVEAAALDPRFGKIIAVGIGTGAGDVGLNQWDVGVFISKDGNEQNLLIEVAKVLDEIAPTKWITYNGKLFDLPFLTVRMMKHGIIPGAGAIPLIDRRRHVDLFDLFGKKGSLDSYGLAITGEGTEGKGSEVGDWYRAEQFDKIKEHCKSDILKLIDLYVRLTEVIQ